MQAEFKRWRPVVLATVSAALFGAATPACKILLGSFPAFQLAGLLYLGAALGVAPVVLIKKELRLPWRLGVKNGLSLLGSLVFGGILGPLFLLMGLKAASGASVSMWLTMEAMATAVLASLLFREHLSWKGWLAVGGTIASALLLTTGDGVSGIRAGLLVTLACVCWGLDNNLQSVIDGISPSQITFWKGLVAGSVNFSIGIAVEHYSASPFATIEAIAVGVLAYGVSLVLYITAAQRLGATRSQAIFASAPFFGLLLSATFLAEGISGIQLFAALLFVAALVVLFKDQHSHEHTHQALAHVHWHSHDDGHHTHAHPEHPLSYSHSDWHQHEAMSHVHRHWPDLHHRHGHP